jgi:hypothetical protein
MNAAAQKVGAARAAAYAKIENDMSKTQSPWAAESNQTNYDFFSAKVGCELWEPSYGMDLAALCLRK